MKNLPEEGGLPSPTKGQTPGTYRPAIQGINPRSQAGLSGQTYDSAHGSQKGIRGQIRASDQDERARRQIPTNNNMK